MKKSKLIILTMALVVVATFVFATDLALVSGNRQDRVIDELQDNINYLVNGTRTLPALGTSGEVTIDGKYAAVGPDATTGLMLQKGTNTLGANGLVTNALSVSFGAAPVVVCGYNGAAGAATNVYASTVASNSIVITGAAGAGVVWHAIGTRP